MPFNLNNNWGAADVAALLASVQDDRNWRLFVDRAGNVSLQDATANPSPPQNVHCYFETYVHGTDHVGPAAAADMTHVSNLAYDLRENWPDLKGDEYIDH